MLPHINISNISKISLVFYGDLNIESFKRYFPISNVSAGSTLHATCVLSRPGTSHAQQTKNYILRSLEENLPHVFKVVLY